MFKKFLLLFIFTASLFVCKAQISVGDWKIHSLYGTKCTNVIDTSDKVYYLVSGNLFVYDKKEQVNEALNKRNKLSDILIRNIYYDYNKKFLLIVYDNSNVDYLYDNGKIINLPDLKDVILSTAKGINDVCINGDKSYLATDFGYIVLNNKKNEVAESRNFKVSFKAIGVVGEKLILSDATSVYISNVKDQNSALSAFTKTANAKAVKICPISNNMFIYDTGYTYLATMTDNNTFSATEVFKGATLSLQPSGNYFLAQSTLGNLRLYNPDGTMLKEITVPTALKSSKITSYSGGADYWLVDPKGLKNIKLDDNGTETVLTDYFKPQASTVNRPMQLVYNNSLNKLFVMDGGGNALFNDYTTPSPVNTLEGSLWTDVTPTVTTANSSTTPKNNIVCAYSLTFDPEDPNTYYVGSWFDGVFKISNGKQVINYNWTNSPLTLNWLCLATGIQFDKNKNLWVVGGLNGYGPIITVLPYSKRANDAAITKQDWKTVNIPGFVPDKSSRFLITKKGDIKIFTNGIWGSSLVFLDDNSTIDVTSDDKMQVYTSLIDQDEKTYTWNYIYCFTEDANGKVWLGTSNGVVELDPTRATNSNFRVNRIKVPRNDGTAYADYLLENESVTCITIDGANRKWIGTKSSGLFLVSADGSQILKKFTTSNSYIPDNQILSVACNPNTNSVYIGTIYGIVEYSSDASPAAEDFSNVYAYPNPVRPEYSGWITVRGLMDNSLVKITDATGTVVSTGLSVGGMYTWDGCNSSGERVKTGVYYVFASQHENDQTKGAVTKVLVVR